MRRNVNNGLRILSALTNKRTVNNYLSGPQNDNATKNRTTNFVKSKLKSVLQ